MESGVHHGMLLDYKFYFGFDIVNPITLDSMSMEKTFQFESGFMFGFYYNPVSTTFYILTYSLYWFLYLSSTGKWMQVRSPRCRRCSLTLFYTVFTCVLGKFYNVFCAEESGGYSIEVFDTAIGEWEERLPLPTGIPRPDNSDFGFSFLEWEGQICIVHGWFHQGDRKECRLGIWALRPKEKRWEKVIEMGLGKKLKSFERVLWIAKCR
ncbi:hypothetical protein AMTRI_Chr13g121720 [Amborella trichopoda]|uniref:F-box associated domain-containing protein n=1 Tax=Amborella trichopoda TaxID=13333 RepID=U5DEF7_AMBTC|nr:hypothetical protein AMTR_s00070p00073680 [Amborella trichopoda]